MYKKHLQRNCHRVLAALTVTTLVMMTACSGSDGGSGSDDGTLKSKNDVLRELSVLDSATDFVARAAPDEGSSSSSRQPLLDLLGALGFGQLTGTRPQASSSTIENCNEAGTRTDEKGNIERQFVYIGVGTYPVNFERMTAAGCQEVSNSDGITNIIIADGVSEIGESYGDTTDGSYSYATAGVNGTAYSTALSQVRNGVTISTSQRMIEGTEESYKTNESINTAAVTVIDYDNQDGDGTHASGHFASGNQATPFRTSLERATGALTLDGPYEYSSLACKGALVTVSTATSVTSVLQDDKYMTTGGEFHFLLGGESATVVFNADGSATYQLSNGKDGSLSQSELAQAFQEHRCD